MFQSILSVIKYFSFFDYPPTFDEIYTFLDKKTTKNDLKKALKNLKGEKKIFTISDKPVRYTIGEYGRKSHPPIWRVNPPIRRAGHPTWRSRVKISQKKLNNFRFKLYLKLLSFLPQIKLVGLSGSMAMMNAKEKDDIDLFIITGKNRLFTGRLIALLLAEILGIRRKFADRSSRFRVSSFNNKVCLNLFFDEKELSVPSFKRSLYVAHEVLQMKPIVNKDQTYEKFLEANRWVINFFPNAYKITNFKFLVSNKFQILNFKNHQSNKNLKFKFNNFGDWIEYFFKKLQLTLIKRHQTSEVITATQLWFHPDDFEKKIKKI